MALGFYLGCSGSGKSAALYRWVISESMLHPDRTYFILIPEQFSLQTQRRIVQSHPRGGILNIDVLSFSRLAWRIFEETGTDPKQVLTETGKNLILRSAASRKRQELRTLGGMLDRQGTITQIKSVLSEFAQYAVSPEQIRQLSDLCSPQPQLRDKLHDIAVLAEAFDKAKENRFVTGEELLLVFADAAPLSRLLDGATFVLDGFTGVVFFCSAIERKNYLSCVMVQTHLPKRRFGMVGGLSMTSSPRKIRLPFCRSSLAFSCPRF